EGQQLRILLHGPVGAGKSSFINSVNSVFKRRVCIEALVENSQDCFTKEYRTYRIQRGNSNTFYPFVLNDMMGLKNVTRRNRRIHVKDVKRALKGHIKDGYKFNPECKISKDDRFYNRAPNENDKVHVLVCLVDNPFTHSLLICTGIPQVAVFTKIDEAFPEIKEDVKNVYKSRSLKEKKFSADVGIPIHSIFPVKNYHLETDVNPDVNAIILNALRHIIAIGDDSLNRKLRSQV
uniref:G domain-containing protein n=1 Tax=Amphilophus citrinellus TaxID=61819 RepID=A0A3Q0T788_AMPCI